MSLSSKLLRCSEAARAWFLGPAPPVEAGVSHRLRPLLLLWACIPLYLLYLVLTEPTWMLQGGMWAEMATNYFSNATSSSLVTRFFALDAGYVPLPQRLLAQVPPWLFFPAVAVPYFYTWSAAVVTALMAGAFCLAPFRALVRNDWLRFTTALVVLLLGAFEVRTFINFTYYAVFFVAICSALALVAKQEPTPWWFCWLPVLALSKPAVLAAMPALALAAVVANPRARLFFAVTLLACGAQVLTMAVSNANGGFNSGSSVPLYMKVIATANYFLAYTSHFLAGPENLRTPLDGLVAGSIVVTGLLLLILWRRRQSNALIFAGLSLVLFSQLLNAFALTDLFPKDMRGFPHPPMMRYLLAPFIGVVLIVVGVIENLASGVSAVAHEMRFVGPALLVLWFTQTGWAGQIARATPLTPAPGVPRTMWFGLDNSNWRTMAAAIDAGGPVCVTIDPFGWIFGRACERIDAGIGIHAPVAYGENSPVAAGDRRLLEIPLSIAPNRSVSSLAVYVRPHGMGEMELQAHAFFTLKDGRQVVMQGGRTLAGTGGMVMLTGAAPVAANDIAAVALGFSSAVEIAYGTENHGTSGSRLVPAVLWFGM